MQLKTVTVTGADDSVEPEDLLALQEKYPFAEFGILISAGHLPDGTSRFPGTAWMRWLAVLAEAHPELKLAGHICGTLVRDIFLGSWRIVEQDYLHAITKYFGRLQINTHAQKIDYVEKDFLDGLLRQRLSGKGVIFQIDGVNDAAFKSARAVRPGAVGLFDLSHGAGLLPSSWPLAMPPYCGYAGGLSPENVVAQLDKIAEAVKRAESIEGQNIDIWIDAETHLRSDNDTIFDLVKVDKFLGTAQHWMEGK